MNDLIKPELCEKCRDIIESSDLRWVECGGWNVGMHKQPLVWRLRSKYDSDLMKKNTQIMRGLAAFSRLTEDMISYISIHNTPEEAVEFRDRLEKIRKNLK